MWKAFWVPNLRQLSPQSLTDQGASTLPRLVTSGGSGLRSYEVASSFAPSFAASLVMTRRLLRSQNFQVAPNVAPSFASSLPVVGTLLGIEDARSPPTCCRCASRVSRFRIYQNIIIYTGPATSCCCASGVCRPQNCKVSVFAAIAPLPVAVQVGSPGFKVTKSLHCFQSFSHFLSVCRQDFEASK